MLYYSWFIWVFFEDFIFLRKWTDKKEGTSWGRGRERGRQTEQGTPGSWAEGGHKQLSHRGTLQLVHLNQNPNEDHTLNSVLICKFLSLIFFFSNVSKYFEWEKGSTNLHILKANKYIFQNNNKTFLLINCLMHFYSTFYSTLFVFIVLDHFFIWQFSEIIFCRV